MAAARRASGRRAAICLVAAYLFLFGWQVAAQPSQDAFEMGKKHSVLTRSSRFETITFHKPAVGGLAQMAVLPSTVPAIVIPAQVGQVVAITSLEKYGILLIRLAPNADPRALIPLVEDFNHQHGSASLRAATGHMANGNPIYASGAVDKLVVDQLIIQFRPGTDPSGIRKLFKLLRAEILSRSRDIANEPFVVRFPGESGHELRDMSNRLDGLQQVVYSQPNFIGIDHRRLILGGLAGTAEACQLKCVEPSAAVNSGDRYFSQQWHLSNSGANGTQFADINAENAWQISQGNSNVVIAILDDLIETSHEDLVGKTMPVWNAFPSDGSGSMAGVSLSATDRHGTAVAGLAAAATNNLKGVAGVAPKVMILPVRTFDPTFPYDVINRAIRYAAENAQVLSMSWSLGETNLNEPVIVQAIEYASVAKRRVLVIAAGNEQGFDVAFPASLATQFPVIAVSATDASDELQKIRDPVNECSWGTQTAAYTVSAPGVDLPTTDRMGPAGYCATDPNKNYTLFSGTSAATPVVAGVAALMLSFASGVNLSPATVRNRLQQTAWHPHSSRRPNDTPVLNVPSGWGVGWGRIDSCNALDARPSCSR